MSQPELNACPHCGSAARHLSVPAQQEGEPINPFAGGHYVECNNAKCQCCTGLMFHEREEDAQAMAAGRWNRRAGNGTGEPPQFPTSLRKMWSGGEVQEWINEHWR
jgi:hypothetical protein